MKKFLTMLMAASMVFAAGCSNSNQSTSTATPSSAASGTFTGSSVGMQGTVTVSMTVEEGKITNVELTEIHETPSVASVAM